MRAWLLVLSVSVLLASCASVARLDAAGDVHALLVAVRDDDQAAFDAHVDRAALTGQLQKVITEQLKKAQKFKGLDSLAALLAQPLAQEVADRLLQPELFLFAARQFGYDPSKPMPDRLTIAGSLRAVDDQTVCAAKSKSSACALIFHKSDGVWRLSGFGPDAQIDGEVR